jgi:hypothetical protein
MSEIRFKLSNDSEHLKISSTHTPPKPPRQVKRFRNGVMVYFTGEGIGEILIIN